MVSHPTGDGVKAAGWTSLEAWGEGTFGRCPMKRTWTSQRPKELSKDWCANEKEKRTENQGLHANAVTL